jgi:hypothetical protein
VGCYFSLVLQIVLQRRGTAAGKIAPAIAGLLEVAVAVVGNGYICGGMACGYCCGYIASRDRPMKTKKATGGQDLS